MGRAIPGLEPTILKDAKRTSYNPVPLSLAGSERVLVYMTIAAEDDRIMNGSCDESFSP